MPVRLSMSTMVRSRLSDSFTFTVSDGAGGSIGATAFGITVTPVNSAPSLATNAGSTVVQGSTDFITSGELQVTDADNTPAQLIYTVTTAPAEWPTRIDYSPWRGDHELHASGH